VIHYTPADYKKYVFAKATVRMRRIEGIIDASMTSMASSDSSSRYSTTGGGRAGAGDATDSRHG